ncbi:MAG: glycosyltransferase family 2 protein [bacterium]|nr:glycosyltransferase family 2 protein [bacterium]
MKYPTVSIIIATLNCADSLVRCLTSIAGQKYPKDKIETIVVDGGSNDTTVEIAKRFNCKVLIKKRTLSEAAKSYGLEIATGELVIDIASDNILPTKDWLMLLVNPLMKDETLVGSYPLRYLYRKTDSIFNRYVALFGVNDPVPFYLGKADRLSYLYDDYNMSGKVEDKSSYYEVNFTPNNMPTLGANGFVMRTNLLKKARIDPAHFFHIDVVYDLVKQNLNSFAVVKTSIIHRTADTLISLIKKRLKYMDTLYLKQLANRRYHMVTKREYVKLLLFVFYSLTLVQPLWVSFVGFSKKKDLAWFLHPLVCFTITLTYIYCVVRASIRLSP